MKNWINMYINKINVLRILLFSYLFLYEGKIIYKYIALFILACHYLFRGSYGPGRLPFRRYDRFRILGGTCRATWGSM